MILLFKSYRISAKLKRHIQNSITSSQNYSMIKFSANSFYLHKIVFQFNFRPFITIPLLKGKKIDDIIE